MDPRRVRPVSPSPFEAPARAIANRTALLAAEKRPGRVTRPCQANRSTPSGDDGGISPPFSGEKPGGIGRGVASDSVRQTADALVFVGSENRSLTHLERKKER